MHQISKKVKRIVQLLLTPLPSFLKIPIYRLLGARIAKGATIAPLTILLADSITLGPYTQIKPLSIVVGRKIELEAYAGISNLCVINGNSDLHLAARAAIGPGCMVDLHAPVTLGEYSALGPRTSLMTHGTFWPTAWGYRNKQAPVEIGDFVWVASDCFIEPGIKIGSQSMIMSATNITRNIKESLIVFSCDTPTSTMRSNVPLALFKKPLTVEFRKKYLQEMLKHFYNDILKDRGYQLRLEQDYSVYEKDNKSIGIFFDSLKPEQTAGLDQVWLWGYGLDEKYFSDKSKICFDFHTLLAQGNKSKAYKLAIKYSRSRWGNTFIDYTVRGSSQLTPPPLVP